MKSKYVGLFLSLCFFISPAVHAEDGPRVEMFSPQGTLKGVRQVSVRFSEQMVPFGDPRGIVDPFDISCPEKGTGRWADGKNWIYDFERDLSAGVRCEFTLKPGLKALTGEEVAGKRDFFFTTGGPSVIRDLSYPHEGNQTLDEEQVFILVLDGDPDIDSVIRKVSFSIGGVENLVGIKIIDGKEKQEILKAHYRYRHAPQLPILLIQCKQRFPSGAMVSLVWGKGVMSQSRIPTDQDQVLRFQVRKPFSAQFHCERENPRAGCIPVTPMTLSFSSAISKGQANRILLKGPDGKTWKPGIDSEEEEALVYRVSFNGPFPEDSSFTVELPPGIKDDAGRPLVNADRFPLSVRTDSYPPLAKFSARFGILEWKADPALPVTLRNLEPSVKARMMKVGEEEGIVGKVMGKILNVSTDKGDAVQSWLKRVAAASREKSLLSGEKQIKDLKVPKPLGARAFEVVGIPLKAPGLYVVELESEILGASLLGSYRPMFVPTAVLVTNLSVHFKWGRESSLVWVTTLDTGEPVNNARVTIRDCQERELWKGTTDASGICRVLQKLPSIEELPHCDYKTDDYDYSQMGALHSLGRGLFIMAQTSDDMAFVHSSWDDGIEPWRFQLPREAFSGPAIAHTIFDRTLLRAGDTVHMKHIFRQHTMKGFSTVAKDRMPDLASIVHMGSDEKYEFPLKWDGSGIAETVWTIPKEAKLGRYEVILREKSEPPKKRRHRRGDPGEWVSGGFRVEEFRVPLLKGLLQPSAIPLINAREVTLDLSVQYLAGGGAGLLPVKLRSEVRPRYVPPLEGFDQFIFGNGPVREGLVRRGGPLESEDGEEAERRIDERKPIELPTSDTVLDRAGTARTALSPLPKVEAPKEILAELEFRDPNGEIQTVSSTIPLWPSKYLIGIKPDSWALSKDSFKFHVALLDLSGKPVPDVSVKVDLFERKTFTHRKRLVGGFYAYEHSVETRRVAALCEGKTDPRGILICEVRSPVSGNVILQAEGFDEAGNRAVTHTDVWVAGKGEWWFEVGDHDRIDLLPEKKRYEPGQTAIFQVRMPFRGATGLITVEREGVIEAWVKRISGKEPAIEVPIKGSYAPNVFVSVLAVRGRLPWIKPTAMVDLGKPAYKLGIAEINVGWRDHELKVNVSSDRKVYKVRQKAKVRIKVATLSGKALPPGSEVAVAAVDEGLLELMANRSWEILPAMMGRRGYEVQTSTAQMQVIGKRHFGLKALPQGGGGGSQTTRELFDTLLLWKSRQVLDANGEASIEIPLNDSITGFRIVAVATGGTGLFGTGSTSIQSTQDLMVLSGLPPLVREGDRFRAEFTLRNTTDRKTEVDILARVEGIPEPPGPLSISLTPGEAKEIGWEVTAPVGTERLVWEVELKERGSNEADRIKVVQRIVPVVPIRTFQATITQVEKEWRPSVERPKDAFQGRGGVRVTFRPKIAEALNGVSDYMRAYPYTCMEQKISVAVALRNEHLWKRWMSDLPSHLDSDGLVKYFPQCLYGSPTLTSYIIAIAHEADWSIPDESKQRMESGLRKFVEGSIVRGSPIPTADLSIRKLSAVEALSRGGKGEARLLNPISIEPNLWPTSAVIDWINILRNIQSLPNRDQRLKEAEEIIRSRLNFQGTTMGFSTEKSDCLWWLMVSNDVNAVRVILSLVHSEGWKPDMPRLVQGALGRQRKGAWDLTLANAWGVLAVEKFSKSFEAVPVSGATRATLLNQSQAIEWSASPKGRTSLFQWPAKKEELSVSHQGAGKPWVMLQGLAAIPLKSPLSSGYKIKKTVIPVQQKEKKGWSHGDILRVRLEMEAQADQTWVVVNDPIPAGATILGSGLGRDSQMLTRGEEMKGWVWPAFEERSFEAFRAYYEYVPKGNWTVEYTIRLNQSGLFQLPNTRVEALYFPEMFGEIPNRTVEVVP